jgi:hypothetical protein
MKENDKKDSYIFETSTPRTKCPYCEADIFHWDPLSTCGHYRGSFSVDDKFVWFFEKKVVEQEVKLDPVMSYWEYIRSVT